MKSRKQNIFKALKKIILMISVMVLTCSITENVITPPITIEETETPEEIIEAEIPAAEKTIELPAEKEKEKNEFVFPDQLQINGTVSAETRELINAGIEKIENTNYRTGFLLVDITSGRTISYQPNDYFYSASTVKAFFAASIVERDAEILIDHFDDLKALLVESSNDAYQKLVDSYGIEDMQKMFGKADVFLNKMNDKYCSYSPVAVAKLWINMYGWLNENEIGKKMAVLYEHPTVSIIDSVINKKWKTQTKGGWIKYDEYYSTTADAGIIYEKDQPYVLVIFSDAPSDFELVTPLAEALIKAHTEMISETAE